MKNIKLFILLISIITLNQSNYTQDNNINNNAQQSLTAYLYSYIVQQPQKSIPAAIDAQKKAIIFDLDGVLCKTNDLQAFYEIGISIILEYMLKHGTPSTKKLFEALENAPAITTSNSFNNGLRMPSIMVDWQTNAQELRDIQDTMVQHILTLPITIIEKNLLISTVLMMTTPERFVSTRQTIVTGIELARTLKKLGYELYILSNWDAHSFTLFQEQFPEVFWHENKELFNGIMISGKTGMIKPDKNIFEKCLEKFNINPSTAIFIDDTIENIQTAESLGIASIHCQNRNIDKVKKQLIEIVQ